MKIGALWASLVMLNFVLYLIVAVCTNDQFILLSQYKSEQHLLTLVLVWVEYTAYHLILIAVPSVLVGLFIKESRPRWMAVAITLLVWLLVDILFPWRYLHMELFITLDVVMLLMFVTIAAKRMKSR